MGKYENDSVLRSDALSTVYIQHGSAPVSNYYSRASAKNGEKNSQRAQKNGHNHGSAGTPYPTYRAAPQSPLAYFTAEDNPWSVHRIYTIAPTADMQAASEAMTFIPGAALPPENSPPIAMKKQRALAYDRALDFSDEAPAASPAPITPPVPACAHVADAPDAPTSVLKIRSSESEPQGQSIQEEPVAVTSSDPASLFRDDPAPHPQADRFAASFLPPESEETDEADAEDMEDATEAENATESEDMTGQDASGQGLRHYLKWWFLREVDISVRGELLTGTPIFLQQDTLRVINDAFSYFIPMARVDYIRTPDGLCAMRDEFDERSY